VIQPAVCLLPQADLVLQGQRVRLEPLQRRHVEALAEWALDPDIWRLTQKNIRNRAEFDAHVEEAIAARDAGTACVFAIISIADQRPIGSTRYQSYDLTNRRLEIGWSWIGRPWHGSDCNTETKLLLLRHAFAALGMMRVEFKANAANARSRRALTKIGATYEGVFRKWRFGPDGEPRDTAWFSIIDDDWPAIQRDLQRQLQANKKTGAVERPPERLTVDAARAAIARGNGRFAELFAHGSLSVEFYQPPGVDAQQPHSRDEIYVVAAGRGEFVQAELRQSFEPGEVLFVPAGRQHRFENFSPDFGAWVFFYGPEGGERPK
jgi:N-acetyltransferase